ncbi:hypothetical protein DFA_11036 [Cavenderia fasciculata]|uniref:SP-RING-type domain-containing protein n=1 Tax=Cavenderia fasciculata TaxID=261658 RepID=F4QEG2_CACFS|nr:uncharacterized protein DFA_11036 [Cavenderia fasciculata]EGG13275.1 hypothetical protein DFA_11036 [Cavenderia fasciculata]|eukprot:XP_004349974.1 hypothetical protein DFA_11036 [Cavenderia fasciculata]
MGEVYTADLDQLIRNYDKLAQLSQNQRYNILQSALSLAEFDETSDMMAQLDTSFLETLYIDSFITAYKADLQSLRQYIESRNAAINKIVITNTISIYFYSRSLKRGQAQQAAVAQMRDFQEFITHSEMIKSKITPQQLANLRKNREFKELKHQIWKVNHDEPYQDQEGGDQNGDDEEDIVLSSQSVNIICPLTKKPFEHPVKSSVCGHMFSRDAIYSMFRNNAQTQCPQIGCSKAFSKSQLERSVDMESTVKRELRKRSRSQKDPDNITDLS